MTTVRRVIGSAAGAVALATVVAGAALWTVFATVDGPRTNGVDGADDAAVAAIERVDPALEARIAGRTVDRVQLFRTGNGGGGMSLTGAELTAVLRHVVPGMIPDGVTEPTIRLSDGRLLIDVLLSSEAYPGAMQLAALLEVIPDTLAVRLEGTLFRDRGQVVFAVDGGWADGVPIPRPILGALVSAVPFGSESSSDGFDDEWGTLHFRAPLPAGIRDVTIVGDRLELRPVEPMVERAVDGSDGA